MMRSYPYNVFMRQNWEYVKDKPLSQSTITPASNILQFRQNLLELDIKVHPDIVDWRIYSLLMFSIVARKRFKVVPAWVPERADISRAEECFGLWDTIASADKAEHFYNFRNCIESDKLDILSKIGLLLRCRYELHHRIQTPAYVPVYLSSYARVIKIPHILNKVVTNHRAWGILSSLHYFPVTVASVEYEAFPDVYNWFLSSFLILSNLLDEE